MIPPSRRLARRGITWWKRSHTGCTSGIRACISQRLAFGPGSRVRCSTRERTRMPRTGAARLPCITRVTRGQSPAAWNPTMQASLIKVLVAHGAEIDRGDRGGATPLHRAVRARSVAAVRQLLSLGARTDGALKKRGSSPLHLAAQPTGAGGTAGMLGDQLEIIDLLLQHGADPTATDAAGRTPRDWATNQRVVKALESRPGAERPPRPRLLGAPRAQGRRRPTSR